MRALLAGPAKRSFLSLTALFVVAGFALGEGGAEVLEFDAGSGRPLRIRGLNFGLNMSEPEII